MVERNLVMTVKLDLVKTTTHFLDRTRNILLTYVGTGDEWFKDIITGCSVMLIFAQVCNGLQGTRVLTWSDSWWLDSKYLECI